MANLLERKFTKMFEFSVYASTSGKRLGIAQPKPGQDPHGPLLSTTSDAQSAAKKFLDYLPVQHVRLDYPTTVMRATKIRATVEKLAMGLLCTTMLSTPG